MTAASALLRTAEVRTLDGDPLKQHRIGVMPTGSFEQNEMLWARLVHFHASSGSGAFFLPEIGDEVVLGCLNNDPAQPVILGSLYGERHTPAVAATERNSIKAIVTRSQLKIEFDDDAKSITITTPAQNRVVLNDDTKSVSLRDQNGNAVTLDASGITISSEHDLTLSSKGNLRIDSTGAIAMTAASDVVTKGLNVTHNAEIAFTGKGNAKAELSASGQTTVKGAMVLIN